jgi:hypothetical protein
MYDIGKLIIGAGLIGTEVKSALEELKEDDILSRDRDYDCDDFDYDDPVIYNPEYKVPLDIYYLSEALEYHFDKLKWELGGKVGKEPLPPDSLEEEDIEEAGTVFSRLRAKAYEKKRRIREQEIIDELVKLLP